MRVLRLFVALLPAFQRSECGSYLASLLGKSDSKTDIVPRSGITSNTAVLLRLSEMNMWEQTWSEPALGKSLQGDESEKRGEKPWKEGGYEDVETGGFRTLDEISGELFERIAEVATSLPGQVDAGGLHKLNFLMYAYLQDCQDYLVVIYRPLLLSQTLDPFELRLLYHRLALKHYTELETLVSSELNVGRRVLLVGAAEAGMVASYHALMLMRRNALISQLGKGINLKNQIQVLGFNTPPPFTHEAIQYYRLARHNYFYFATSAERTPDFGYLGECFVHHLPASESSKGALSDPQESYVQTYFNSQILRDLGRQEPFKSATTYNDKVKGEFTKQIALSLAGRRSALAVYKLSFQRHRERFLYTCTRVLQQMLRGIISTRHRAAQSFVSKYSMLRNWTLGRDIKDVKCVIVDAESVNCMTLNGNDPRIFATYHITRVEGDALGETVASHEITPSTDDEHIASSLETPLDQCLFDLFQAQPELKLISPFHRESSFQLKTSIWPYTTLVFKVRLADRQTLSRLFTDDLSVFLRVMTNPAIENPLRCQKALTPSPGVYDASTIENYWRPFVSFLKNHQSSKTHAIVDRHLSSHRDIPDSVIFSVLHKYMDADDRAFQHRQYDCTDPQTLWHSYNFCPMACRVLNASSNFCKRIYISKKGLKMSIRGASSSEAVTSYFESSMIPGVSYLSSAIMSATRDKSLEELNFIKELKLDHPDRMAILLTVKRAEDGQTLYMAIFAEGEVRQALIDGISQVEQLSLARSQPSVVRRSYEGSQLNTY